MISVYDFVDYRKYLLAWIEEQKHQTKGLQGKLAQAAGISSTLISLILADKKHLSLEQAVEISEFVGLTENENEFFCLLVEYAKAGSVKLQNQLKKRIDKQKKSFATRLIQHTELDDKVKAIYYSTWLYAAIRNLVATPGQHDVQSIAKRLAMPTLIVANAIEFLVQNGLCSRQDGRLSYAVKKTYIGPDSPFVNKHHQNWRLHGFAQMDSRKATDHFFTSPMSLSQQAAEQVKALLPKFVEQVMGIAGPSDSEVLYCFNMDWFEF